MVYPGRLKQYLAQCLAELFGTFILVFIGNLSVAQAKLSNLPRNDGFAVNLSYSTGVYVALMIAGPISGMIVSEEENILLRLFFQVLISILLLVLVSFHYEKCVFLNVFSIYLVN
mgnify:CR=1 FL=1